MSRPVLTVFTALVAAACWSSCGGGSPAENGRRTAVRPPQPAATAKTGVAEARALFDSLCFTCHGAAGRGDGPGAAALDPKPRSFADASWQESVTDAQIEKAIVYGGAAVGKSPMMPAQPQLKGKAEVLGGLVSIVRGFRAP